MSELHFFDIAALTGDHRLRRELREVWNSLHPPSDRVVEAHLGMKHGFDRSFTDEERARARAHLMHLMAEDALRRRLGWSDDDLWEIETEEEAAAVPDAAARARTADRPAVLGFRPLANDLALPQLLAAAGTGGSKSGQAPPASAALGIDMVDPQGRRLPLFRDEESRIYLEFGGAPPTEWLEVRTRHGETFDVKVELRDGRAYLGPQIGLVDIIEGADEGVLQVVLRR